MSTHRGLSQDRTDIGLGQVAVGLAWGIHMFTPRKAVVLMRNPSTTSRNSGAAGGLAEGLLGAVTPTTERAQ